MVSPHSKSYPFLALAQAYEVPYAEILALADYRRPPAAVRYSEAHFRNQATSFALCDRLFGKGPTEERAAFIDKIDEILSRLDKETKS